MVLQRPGNAFGVLPPPLTHSLAGIGSRNRKAAEDKTFTAPNMFGTDITNKGLYTDVQSRFDITANVQSLSVIHLHKGVTDCWLKAVSSAASASEGKYCSLHVGKMDDESTFGSLDEHI